MMQLYRVILTIFCLLVVSGLYAQPYDPHYDPCDAEADPVPYGTTQETQTLMGDLINNAFITDLAGGMIQDFGVAGADSSAFYKLNFDENASFIQITWIDGSLDNMSVGLFSVTDPCGGGTGSDFGEMLYQDADGNDLLEEDLTSVTGSVTFELCNLDPADYDNIYLWLASSEVGDFEITVMQRIRPENNECDFTPEDLGQIEPGNDITRTNESNQWACRNNLVGSMCLTNAHDGAGVWYEFSTDDVVEMIDLLVEHDNDNLDVAILELNPDCTTFNIVDCDNVTNGEVEFLELAVKRNTTYHIFINTPQDDWGQFDITLSACDPPANFSLCDHEAVDFPELGDYNPDNAIPGTFNGTTECAYPFYDDNAQTEINDFGCAYTEMAAVYYKLNVDPNATKLVVESVSGPTGTYSAEVIMFNSAPDCVNRGYEAIINESWGQCNFATNDIEVDLCDKDNSLYDHIYLMVATNRSNEGEFEIDFYQEIAPYNDLCDDPSDVDRGAGDLGLVEHGDNICENSETNRGACPSELGMPAGEPCLQGFEDEPMVWYTFETGDDVELVDITVEHDGNNLRVAIFEMSNPCGAGTVQVPGGDFDVYCSQGGDEALFEQLTVKSNTVYHILVSTPEADWDDFSICIDVCEPPANYDICNAEEINYPGPAHNADNPIPGSSFDGTTVCAYGFFDDVDLNDLIEFDCGDDFESAVFYKLNVDDYASKLEIAINKLGGIGTVAAQIFIFDGTPDCDSRGFEASITEPDGVNSCNFTNAANLVLDLCEIDNDDYDNLYLWIATSKEDQGDFELDFYQEIAPINDLCDDPSDVARGAFALGVINHNDDICENDESNRGACPVELDMPAGEACLEGFEDEATVWYTFETGDDVELVDITVDHDGNNLRVAVFEMTTPCMAGGFEVPGGDFDVYCTQGGAMAQFEQLTVKSNTTYYILVSTPEADWDDFSICVEACEPPANFDMCNAEELDFPEFGDYNPDNSVLPTAGTTECAFGFFDDVNLNELIHFDCGDDFESAVFYKLNVDDYASKLEIEITKSAGIGTVAAQVFIFDGTPDCDARGFEASITIPGGDGFNICDFTNATNMVMDLCEIDNDDYDNLYLWIATSKEDQGEFDLEFFQEIAPYNDLCDDISSGDRGAGDLGVINQNDGTGDVAGCSPPPGWTGTQTNRGACPVEFDMPSACLEGFEDEPTVWYTFETGDDVEEVNIIVEHDETTNLRVAVFEMLTPCMVGTLQVPGDDLDAYCEEGGDAIEFEKLTLKSNTVYYILVSSPEAEWGEFSICIEACEPPVNFDMCNAEELDFPALGDYNPDNPALDTDGNTECAFGFFNDVNLSDLIHFECGDEFESAVFYKLNVDEYASKLDIAINIGTAGTVAAQVFIFDGVPDCENNGFNPSITIPTEDGFNICNFTSALNMEMDLCGIDNEDYDNLYLWIATSKEDQGDFDLEFFQEIAPYNDMCDDDSDPDQGAGDLGVINFGDETGDITGCTPPAGWTGVQTNRGACPFELGMMPTACLQGFEDEATVWYTFETGDNVELVDIFVEHDVSDNLRVAIFEMADPCMAGTTLQVPGDLDDYCTSGGGDIEFEDLTVQPNTVYFIIVSTPQDEWGELSICIETCEPPDNFNICDAEELNFPGLGGYDPDNPALDTDGDTECSFGFFNDVQLTELIEFDCGVEFDAAVFYKLNIDEFATKLEIAITKGTAGVVAAQVFFFDGVPDCENRGFLPSITVPADDAFNICNFSEGVNMEMDLCEIDNALYEDMYLWIATSKDDWGDFELEFYQEIAPENDECEDAIEVGTFMPGDEICETGTTRGACPILYGGPTACFDGFPEPDEAGVWYTFETGEGVELLSVSIDHTNSSNVRLALFELPDGCGEDGLIPGDPDDYCVVATNGIDSIWNILVKQETQYYLLVSTPVDDWGEFEICINNCEPPENDTACDAARDPEYIIVPGEEESLDDRGDPEVVEGTTVCANNFFVDFDLTYETFGCGDEFESSVFYQIDVDENATELWITGSAPGLGSMAFGLFSATDICDDGRVFGHELWLDAIGEPMVDCNAAGGGEVIFDLCGMTADDKENIFLWVATERKDQGEFELEISQKVGPPNDDCENAETLGELPSDIDVTDCFNMSNLFACPETFDPDLVENPSNADIECEEDPLGEDIAGVWFEFRTDSEAGRIDVTLDHDNDAYLGFLMYEVTGGCDEEMIIRICERDTMEMGYIEFENYGIDPETNYRIFIYTDKEDAGDYELCINVKPPIECLGQAPYFYNHTDIICGLNALNDFCLFMGVPFPPAQIPWPNCETCCGFHNPQWFSFVAGEDQTLSIDVFISECQNNQGVQIALYELNCDVPFDPTEQSTGIQPTPDQMVSDCNLVNSPQNGTVNFTVDTEPGQVYGIVVDGWSNDQCKVEILDVLSGGEPPELEEDLIGEPEFDPIPPWDSDTICAGAVDVPFSLVGEVPNACTYIWTLANLDLMTLDTLEVEDPTEVLIDFPEPGEYEICVSATNLCASTEPVCRMVWVLPLTPEVTIDTLCKREPYVWLGPFGEILETYDGFADDWGFGMNPNPDPFEDMRTAVNEFDCEVDAFLELYVIPDNYLPTVDDEAYFQEVICFGDHVEMPDGSQYTQTGIFGTEGEIFIPQQSFPECDSFFILELSVLEVRLNWEDPFCLQDVIFIFPQDVPSPPEFLPGGAGQEIYIQWVRLSDNDTMYTGTQSDGTLLGGLVWEITPDDFNNDIETFEATIIMDIDGEPDPGCLFGPWEITIDLNDLYPDEPEVTYPDVVCTDNLVAIEIEDIFGSGLTFEWDIMLDPSDYIIVNDSTETLLEIIFLTEETVEICITPFNDCGPGTPACIEIEVSEPPVSDAGPDDISCDLTYTMQGGGDNGVWSVASRPMNSNVNFADNTDPQTDVTVDLYGEYNFVWTERIGNLVSCATNDTVSIFFNEPPLITNIRYECDSLGQFYTATFDIIGVTGPYDLVVGPGTIDSASYTSPLTPDLQPIEVVIADGNGCESELIVLNVRCDCPTEVGQLDILALNLCEDDCFETENYYDDSEQVYVPGEDTVLFFLQTTNMFSVDEDDWVDVNNDGVFCGDILDVEIGVPYYVYVAVGPIDSLTGFIDLDLEDFENCTRITQRKPITWRGQPIAEAFGGEICGVEFTLDGTASFGEGLWTQISGPGTIDFDDANDVGTSITADLCGDYQLQWRESNFGCADSIQVDVGLNCIPELGDVSFNCDNEDISYWLSFEIESGTQNFEVVYPTGYDNAISGNTFTHPAVPNRGDVLDTFLIVDANGCELEVILDINCNCQPIPGEMDGDIDVCETETQVQVGPFVVDPFFEPGDVATYVLHTSPGTELVDPLVVNDAGVFNFDDTTGIECNVTYYISHVVGPPDSLGNVDFVNGCTRVGPGQPVLWRCQPTADAGDDPDPICGITEVPLSGTSTHGTGSWSGGSGEFANPDNPSTTYTPDSSEIGTVVTLTYTTEGDEGVCPSVSDEISFLVDEERIADAGADQIFCEIEDVQLSASSNGEPGMWSGGSGTFNDATLNNAVYSPDVSEQGEVITLTWTTTAGEGCPEVSDEMTIEIVDDLTAVPGEDRIACFLSTDLDAELPGNLDGVWTSADPGVVFEDVNSPSSEVTVPDLGTYCFTWTVSIGDCEHSDEVCITFVDAPVVVDTTFECNDVSTQYFVTILIEGGDASSYTVNGEPITGDEYVSDWIGSNQAATFIINDENDCGPYELNVRHVCECLTEVGSMNGPTQILCEDETANFTGFYNDSDEFLDGNDIRVYVLHDGDANDLGSILEMNTTGTFGFGVGMNYEESYWVAVGVGDSLGNSLDMEDPCRLFSNSVEVIWYEYPDASIATPDILTCDVTEVTITANIDEPYIEYSWSTANGNIVGASDMREVVVSSVGTYTLVVTDTRSGCSSTDQITVTDDVTPPEVVIETPETLTCAVLEVEIDGSGSSSGNFTYEWSGPGIVANGTSPVVTVNAPGTYTLMVTSTTNGCANEETMTVNQDIVPPVAAATVNAELDCSTDEVTISAQGSSEGAIYTYSWEVDGVDGNIVSGANQFDAVVDESGMYQLVVTNTDNGCRDTTTVEVIEIDDVVTGAVITTSGIDCFGDRDGVLTIEEVEGGTAPYRYSFDGGATFGNNPERVNVNPGTYDIVIEDARGCVYDTIVTLIEPDLLEVDLGANVVVELGQTVTLTAEVNTDESNIEQWIWDPVLDPTCENCPDQVFLPEGETFVQLTVIDSNGCVATASVSVFITVVREIYIPNIFSPNRDGINDYFGIYTAPLRVREIKEFRIWDRWGEQMFHREGLPSPTELDETNAWDGMFNGEPMQPGVFMYYIVVEFADGVEEVYQGDFTLMR